MQRRPQTELLDSDTGTPKEVADSLLDLRWFNRWFGGISTSRELIQTVVEQTGKKDISILEVAAGEGFIPQLLQAEFEQSQVRLRFTLLDRMISHLPENGSTSKIAGDALTLPLRDESFDLVSSSLFFHHLDPEQAVRFLKEALRVCRTAVLVHDLIRHPLHLALAYAGLPLYRSRLTRNDAPASVWQAYTVGEMRNFLNKAGARKIEIKQSFLYRMGVIAWKRG